MTMGFRLALVLASLVLGTNAVQAQTYPDRNVTIVVTSAAGAAAPRTRPFRTIQV